MIIRGVDTLEFGLDIENYKETFLPLLRELKYFKDQGQQTGKALEYEINGINFTIEKSGMPFYAYRLTCKDFIVGFAEKEIEDNSPVRVKLLSGFLWSFGYKEAYIRFLEWFEKFEADIIGSRLSRVDICVDTDEVIFVRNDIDGFVSRAKSKENYYVSNEYKEGKIFSGLRIGKGNLMARIYDKSIEIKTSGKVWFEQIWIDNGWNKEKPIWRVEFQIKRKILKEFKINQVNSLWDKEDNLWTYLTGEWLQLKNNKSYNLSRWKEKKKWKIIRNAKNDKKASPLIRDIVKKGNITRLMNQASGLVLSIGAVKGYSSYEESLKAIKEWGEEKLKKEGSSYNKKIEERKKKFI